MGLIPHSDHHHWYDIQVHNATEKCIQTATLAAHFSPVKDVSVVGFMLPFAVLARILGLLIVMFFTKLGPQAQTRSETKTVLYSLTVVIAIQAAMFVVFIAALQYQLYCVTPPKLPFYRGMWSGSALIAYWLLVSCINWLYLAKRAYVGYPLRGRREVCWG